MAPRLSAVILAAGLSSRMGRPKAALPLGPATVLDRCFGLFRSCGIDELVVVTGHHRPEVGAIARRAGVREVHNPDYASGMYSSIQAGVRQLTDDSNGFFLLPVDIALVRPGTIRWLTRSFAAAGAAITYPTFTGRRGHPPLIGRDLVPAILGDGQPEGGLRSLLAAVENRRPQSVVEVPVPDANILFDMDTPAEYAGGLGRFARLDYPTPEEATALLRLQSMPEEGLAHGRLVGAIAMALCRAVAPNSGRILEPELCLVCGWLHDMAKGHADHAQEAGRWLRELGFDRAAAIVEAHTELNRDMVWLPGAAITEKELVHLADKLVRGSRVVSFSERFEEKLALYRDRPEAVRAIRRRKELARQLGAAVEAATGRRLDDIVADALHG